MNYKNDCKFFRGDIPCKPHKIEGVHCDDCKYYEPCDELILIIKLGAIGDVIRTTPLITKLKAEHPKAAIWWLTYSPDVVPSIVDKALPFSLESIISLQAMKFRKILNLDKDHHACALASGLHCDELLGYTLTDGKPAPANFAALSKFMTGLFDDVNQTNKLSYLEEIFIICGYTFNKEEYILEFDNTYKWNLPSPGKGYIGLNTGCGERWTSRLWKYEYWEELIKLLQNEGYSPILLGGSQEHTKNESLSDKTGACYLGHFDLKKFISLVNCCDLVVTAVTMGLHLAVGLKKKVVLMNNIFNPNEFELYGRGTIVQPANPCHCFFSPKCKNTDYFCLDSLTPQKIMDEIYGLM